MAIITAAWLATNLLPYKKGPPLGGPFFCHGVDSGALRRSSGFANGETLGRGGIHFRLGFLIPGVPRKVILCGELLHGYHHRRPGWQLIFCHIKRTAFGRSFLSLYAFDWQTRFTHIGSPGYRSTRHGCCTPLLPHQSSRI